MLLQLNVRGAAPRPCTCRPSYYRFSTPSLQAAEERAAAAASTPPDVARLYDFPQGLDGSGQCIAIIELAAATARPT